MDVLYPNCAGIDVHKKTVVVCCLTPHLMALSHGDPHLLHHDSELLLLSDWLTSKGITHVAMESTGEFWKPLYNLLEGNFTILVVNAHHMHNVPGRKTDVKDAEWIADLLAHGLLAPASFPLSPNATCAT